jgi:hypothetical protein
MQEAGGIVEPYEGPMPFPLIPHEDYDHTFYPMILAADNDLAKNAHSKITPRQK